MVTMSYPAFGNTDDRNPLNMRTAAKINRFPAYIASYVVILTDITDGPGCERPFDTPHSLFPHGSVQRCHELNVRFPSAPPPVSDSHILEEV